jgi:hypothetical protein
MTDPVHIDTSAQGEDEPEFARGEGVQAAVDSPLAAIRERHRQQREQASSVDLAVPDLDDPPVFVRYRTDVSHDRIKRMYNKREKRGKQQGGYDWEVLAAADVLVEACVGVYTKLEDGTKVGYALDADKDDWPAFDLRLADMVGMDVDQQKPPRAVDVARALYGSDPRVIQASGDIARIVGYAEENEGLPGE